MASHSSEVIKGLLKEKCSKNMNVVGWGQIYPVHLPVSSKPSIYLWRVHKLLPLVWPQLVVFKDVQWAFLIRKFKIHRLGCPWMPSSQLEGVLRRLGGSIQPLEGQAWPQINPCSTVTLSPYFPWIELSMELGMELIPCRYQGHTVLPFFREILPSCLIIWTPH